MCFFIHRKMKYRICDFGSLSVLCVSSLTPLKSLSLWSLSENKVFCMSGSIEQMADGPSVLDLDFLRGALHLGPGFFAASPMDPLVALGRPQEWWRPPPPPPALTPAHLRRTKTAGGREGGEGERKTCSSGGKATKLPILFSEL